MATSLFPVFDVPSRLAEDVHTGRKYKPAPLFDIESGDFILNGARQPLYGTGYDAWVLWCTKAIMTERFAHFAYSGGAGIEADNAFKSLFTVLNFHRKRCIILLKRLTGGRQCERNIQAM